MIKRAKGKRYSDQAAPIFRVPGNPALSGKRVQCIICLPLLQGEKDHLSKKIFQGEVLS
jgi:hypothetical protein